MIKSINLTIFELNGRVKETDLEKFETLYLQNPKKIE